MSGTLGHRTSATLTAFQRPDTPRCHPEVARRSWGILVPFRHTMRAMCTRYTPAYIGGFAWSLPPV